MTDEIVILELPNAHQVIEDWTTLFTMDIKVIDSGLHCNIEHPGSQDLFHYVWLGEK